MEVSPLAVVAYVLEIGAPAADLKPIRLYLFELALLLASAKDCAYQPIPIRSSSVLRVPSGFFHLNPGELVPVGAVITIPALLACV